jgi:hypothetical protein
LMESDSLFIYLFSNEKHFQALTHISFIISYIVV